MNYRILGRTSLNVSEIGIGTMVHAGHFGHMEDEESIKGIETALELGVNFIDSSDAYGMGYGEEILGRVLKDREEEVVLATKGGVKRLGSPPDRDFSPAHLSKGLEGSLRRLRRDVIDLYLLHNPTVDVIRNGEALEFLQKQKEAGKIRFFGVSINTEEEALAALDDGRSEAIQIEYNILVQWPGKKVFPLAMERKVGIIARVPLRRGLLTGKFTPDSSFPEGDVRGRLFAGEALARELAKVEKLHFLLKGPVQSLVQAAIKFCLSHPAVSTTIPGMRNAQQARESISASGEPLPEEHLALLRELYQKDFQQ